jgi:hypothetical protein
MAAARDGRALFTFWRWDSLRPRVGSIGHSPVDRRVRARLRDYSSSVRIQAAGTPPSSPAGVLGSTDSEGNTPFRPGRASVRILGGSDGGIQNRVAHGNTPLTGNAPYD